MNYECFFKTVTGLETKPYPYQTRLAFEDWPDLLDIPTGLGKTAAVAVGWLWKRLLLDQDTPIRLVYCLPMRVLVEQTYRNITNWVQNAQSFFLGKKLDLPGVHLVMGGEVDTSWIQKPEQPSIIIGTQDMLLSRALMRGYGMSRYQWPIHFALLHNDSFWVFDEVQLMGPGLSTSAQLEGLRRRLRTAVLSRSLWLSATMNPDWLETIDMKPYKESLVKHSLSEQEKQLPAIKDRIESVKRLNSADTSLTAKNSKNKAKEYTKELSEEILSRHRPKSTTLVILNTVERAQSLMQALQKRAGEIDLVLVHARFRPAERNKMEDQLRKNTKEEGRIVVATQAVEAGIDMTSKILFTEIAPWSSLVQRFGRCNRYGEFNEEGGADIFWIDLEQEAKLESPYQEQDISLSREKITGLTSASSDCLPSTYQEALQGIVLRRKDLLEIFNTDPDLSGFDTDVSAYIRDADEIDVQVFWRELDRDERDRPITTDQPGPARDELCRASLSQIQKYLNRIRKKSGNVLVWDSLLSVWQPMYQNPRPGLTLMLDARLGGYDPDLGFLPDHSGSVNPLINKQIGQPEDYGSDCFSLQQNAVLLSNHLRNVYKEAQELCFVLQTGQEDKRSILSAAGCHDLGKAHPAFQNMLLQAMDPASNSNEELWAKSNAAGTGRPEYFILDNNKKISRPFFRHELASMLAWLTLNPEDPQVDLIAYLIAAHHGKVRMGLRAQPGEAEPPEHGRLFARGIWNGDVLSEIKITEQETYPQITLQLDIMQLGESKMGPSWTARTQELLSVHGPFRLAWLESLVRIADQRASRKEQEE